MQQPQRNTIAAFVSTLECQQCFHLFRPEQHQCLAPEIVRLPCGTQLSAGWGDCSPMPGNLSCDSPAGPLATGSKAAMQSQTAEFFFSCPSPSVLTICICRADIPPTGR